MPIYEYECQQCHATFELMQKIQDKPVTKCPECLNDTAERMVSRTSFQLKGTGWYETDFKNKKPNPSQNKTENNSETKAVKEVKKESGKESS